ncbi:MAG TPA: hypothetical protein VHZ99_08145 [Steroidobacteraceae bacterium]|jgi:uncharacterized protein involved in exopolysaccharide biosynthesis|nr:hypothetical protein [Steroidobacteraceae bacterium]
MSAPAVGEETVSIGLLLEAAQSQQQLVETSLRRLQGHTATLDDVVRDTVRRTIVAEFGALGEHCSQAIDSVRRAGRAATLRSLWTGAVLTGVTAAMAILAVRYCVPSRAQIAALRMQQAVLQENVARLIQSGGRIDLQRCGETHRLCVRVDRHGPSFGEHGDYLVVEGY